MSDYWLPAQLDALIGIPATYVERHAPHYPPIPLEEYEAFNPAYAEVIPYRWTGDLLQISSRTYPDKRRIWPNEQNAARYQTNLGDRGDVDIYFDVGELIRLKSCGHSAVNSGSCPLPEDLLGVLWEQARAQARLNSRGNQAIWGAILSGMIIVVGFIPVIGQGAAVLMASAVALASGKSIPAALVDMFVNAIPGGALVKNAVLPALEFGKSILSGDTVEQAAISAAREQARLVGGDSAAQAFDLIFAVARGQDLQEVGFGIMNRWFKGTDLIDKVGSFTLRTARAASRGESVERLLLNEARMELSDVAGSQVGLQLPPVQDQVDRAVSALLADPRRYLGSIQAFAGELIIPIEVARAAFMSVEETAHGLRENAAFRRVLIDPDTVLQGESQMVERTQKWMQRKVDIRPLLFQEAEPVTSSDVERYLQTTAPAVIPVSDTVLVPAAVEGPANVRPPIDFTPRRDPP